MLMHYKQKLQLTVKKENNNYIKNKIELKKSQNKKLKQRVDISKIDLAISINENFEKGKNPSLKFKK